MLDARRVAPRSAPDDHAPGGTSLWCAPGYYISRPVRVSSFESPDAYYAFAVVGLVILQLLNATLQIPRLVTLLPGWVECTSDIQPFSAAVELLRNVIAGTSLSEPAWLGLAKLVGFFAVMMPLAVLALQRAILVSRRRGTLIEY